MNKIVVVIFFLNLFLFNNTYSKENQTEQKPDVKGGYRERKVITFKYNNGVIDKNFKLKEYIKYNEKGNIVEIVNYSEEDSSIFKEHYIP